MTKIITLMSLFLLPLVSCCQPGPVAALQEKYKDDNVFALSLTGNILKFLNDDDAGENDPDFRRLAQKIHSLHILAVSNKSQGYSSRDITKLKREIRKRSFEEVISVKSGKGQLQLLVKDRHGKPTELILIVDKDSEGFITMDFSEKSPE